MLQVKRLLNLDDLLTANLELSLKLINSPGEHSQQLATIIDHLLEVHNLLFVLSEQSLVFAVDRLQLSARQGELRGSL
jgi:hypothetical protein